MFWLYLLIWHVLFSVKYEKPGADLEVRHTNSIGNFVHKPHINDMIIFLIDLLISQEVLSFLGSDHFLLSYYFCIFLLWTNIKLKITTGNDEFDLASFGDIRCGYLFVFILTILCLFTKFHSVAINLLALSASFIIIWMDLPWLFSFFSLFHVY